MFYWISYTIYTYGNLPWIIATLAVLLLSLYLSLYYLLGTYLVCRLNFLKNPNFLKGLGVAFVFTGIEYLKAHLLTGLPWEEPGYTLTSAKSLLQLASIFGIQGLNFLFYLTSYFLFLVFNLSKKGNFQQKVSALLFSCVLLGVFLWGKKELNYWRTFSNSVNSSLKVAVIQPNIPQKVKLAGDITYMFSIYSKMIKLAAQKHPDLVLLPETALTFFYPIQKSLFKEINTIFSSVKNSFVITGIFRANCKSIFKCKIYNSLILLKNGKVLQYYDKEKLVPFGEYLPVFLKFLDRFTVFSQELTPGNPSVLHFYCKRKKVKILPLICFESAFSDILKQRLSWFKPNLVVIATNDAWFDDSSAPYQHFQMAIVRAVESRKFVIQVANTGISGIISPAGDVIKISKVNTPCLIFSRVKLIEKTSPFYRFGDVLGILGVFFVLACVFLCVKKKLRSRV